MLFLQLKDKEYLTIGDDIVIQVFTNSAVRVSVQAPRELTVLRGEVLERAGGQRPDCVFDTPRWHRQEIPWNRSKAQALTAMRALLAQMDGKDGDVQALRRQLEHMFPSEAKQTTEVSNG